MLARHPPRVAEFVPCACTEYATATPFPSAAASTAPMYTSFKGTSHSLAIVRCKVVVKVADVAWADVTPATATAT